jgi:uncharacterized protein DUF955
VNGDLEAVRKALDEMLAVDAEDLLDGRALPLNLMSLANELGLGVRRRRLTTRDAPHGELIREGPSWRIVVNASTSATRQRFTIAHEIGHYIVEARTQFRPTSNREYWMLESVCHRFAAELLAPRDVVEQVITDSYELPSGLFTAIDALIERVDISLEAAVTRIVDVAPSPLSIGAIRLPAMDGAYRPGSILWLHESQPWLAQGRGQKIRKDNPLRNLTVVALSLPVGHHVVTGSELHARPAAIQRRTPSLALFVVGTGLEGGRAAA